MNAFELVLRRHSVHMCRRHRGQIFIGSHISRKLCQVVNQRDHFLFVSSALALIEFEDRPCLRKDLVLELK